MEYAGLAVLGLVTWKLTEPKSHKEKVEHHAKRAMQNEYDSTSSHISEDLTRGQIQSSANTASNIESGWGAGYVPSGRAPWGSSLETTVETNSRNMALWQRARTENAFRQRAHSINQANVHTYPQLMASLTDESVSFNPRAKNYPFRYDEQRTMVDREEQGPGSSLRPDPKLTGTPSTHANDNISIFITQERSAQSINPFARRGEYTIINQPKPQHPDFSAYNRTALYEDYTHGGDTVDAGSFI